MTRDFNRIPKEMQDYPQWVCYRLEDRHGPKPTKVPYNAMTGELADITNPNDLAPFSLAVVAATIPSIGYDGIGFALTEKDPYTIIDLDNPFEKKSDGTPKYADSEKIFTLQKQVLQEMDSYSEVSPSGKGLHIIVKAHIAQGRRRSNIELYHKDRYMTMTGDVYRDRPIENRQALVEQLWAEMGGGAGAAVYNIENQPQRENDDVIITRALNAANGQKFRDLNEGRWQHLYPSQSEADLAYNNMLVFYTQNIEQVIRIFLNSPLGARPKAHRRDYALGLVHKAFDQILPPIDFVDNASVVDKAVAEYQSKPAVIPTVAGYPLMPIAPPPGLMGDIAKFIYDAAPRPVSKIALVGAIGFMAGIAGRAYNISDTGLNHYILLLAPTGSGKEAIAKGISKLLKAVEPIFPASKNCRGPSRIASGQALLRHLAEESACCFSIIGEFGLYMQRLSGRNILQADLTTKDVLLDLYNKSGANDVMAPMVYAEKSKNISTIDSPNFTIIGESNPRTFYDALDEVLIANGLLPRFIIIEYEGGRPKRNKNHINAKIEPELVNQLAALLQYSSNLQQSKRVITVEYAPNALEFLDDLDERIDAIMDADKENPLNELWNRVHKKTLKLAGLTAVGHHMTRPVVTLEIAQWAFNVIAHDVHNILTHFKNGEIGKDTEEIRQTNKIIELIRTFITKPFDKMPKFVTRKMYDEKTIPYTYFRSKLGNVASFKRDKMGPTYAIKRALKNLEDEGDMRTLKPEETLKQYDKGGLAYVVVNPYRFLNEQ